MQKPLLFYSTNTQLAHFINTKFYGGQHYIWCAPVFNPSSLNRHDPLSHIPQSSSPHDIYINLKKAMLPPDMHSPLIRDNKRGLKKGAAKMLADGKITESYYQSIMRAIKTAQVSDFTPFLYVIPTHLVEKKLVEVEAGDAANPKSTEYRIFDLLANEFDILELDY